MSDEKKIDRLIYSLGFYELLLYLASDMYLPGLKVVQSQFHMNSQEALFTITIWFIGILVSTPLACILSVYFGRIRMLLSGVLIFSILNLSVSLFTHKFAFFVFRFIQGALVSLFTVPSYAFIHDTFGDQDAVKFVARINSILIFASLLGPFLGSLLLLVGTWQLGFIVIGIGSVFIFLLLYSGLSKDQHKEQTFFPIRIIGTGSELLSYFFLIFGMFTIAIWITGSPNVMMTEFALSPLQYGLTQMGIASGFILGAAFVSKEINHIGLKPLIRYLGLYAFPALLAALPFIFLIKSLISILIFMFFIFFTFGCIAPLITRLIMNETKSRKDYASAWMSIFANIGTVLGSFLLTLLYEGNFQLIGILYIFSLTASALLLARIK